MTQEWLVGLFQLVFLFGCVNLILLLVIIGLILIYRGD